jgi:hypothetical protein
MSMHPDPVGDLEYDPQEYPELHEPMLAGKADVVIGSRFMGGRPHRVLFLWHIFGDKFLVLNPTKMPGRQEGQFEIASSPS